VAAMVLSSTRSKIVVACLCAGGFILLVCLFIPLEGLLLSEPLYDMGEAGIIAFVSTTVVMAGCLLSANPRRTAVLVFGLVISATLMFAGSEVLVSLAIYHPKRLLGFGPAMAVLMTIGGYLLAKYLARRESDKASVGAITGRGSGGPGGD
jgi:hypothetical protein